MTSICTSDRERAARTRSRAGQAARGVAAGLLASGGTAFLSTLLAHTSGRVLLPLTRWSTAAGPARVEDLIVGVLTGIGALVAAWYALSALVAAACALVQLCGATWRAGEAILRRHGAPGVARLVGAGAGAALAAGLALTPAHADAPDPAGEPGIAEDLTWAAAADEGASGAGEATPPAPTPTPPPTPSAPSISPRPAEPAEAAEPAELPAGSGATGSGATGSGPSTGTGAGTGTSTGTGDPGDDRYIVQPGDTLWAIAAAHLGPDADDAEIAAAWPRWYAANAPVIGSDPDLILPGTPLSEPD